MIESQVAPYGSWKSPISPDLIASGTIKLEQVVLDGRDIYWIEMRPTEGGRHVIVKRSPNGTKIDVIPMPFNSRNRAHEYGGGSFTVFGEVVYFSNFADQRLYRQDLGSKPQPITPKGNFCYADGTIDPSGRFMACVREDHSNADGEPINSLVCVNLLSNDVQVLASENDFYSSPRFSPDGKSLAWLSWNHPNMPWDGTQLWVGELSSDGSLRNIKLVAGGVNESIFQPEWSPDKIIHFVSDKTGWWNLYRGRDGDIEPLHEDEAEFGRPQWVFGLSTYAFESKDRIICTYFQRGLWKLANLGLVNGELEPLEIPYTEISYLKVKDGYAVFVAGSPNESPSIVKLDLSTGDIEVLCRSIEAAIDSNYLSAPQSLQFPSEKGQIAYAFFYPPRNGDYASLSEELPPLLVLSHGGPTAAASTTLNLSIQYWTSRGIAVLDVNYGGSTGYGRKYRERLNGQWGIVDVKDCVNGALHLVEQGEVDGNRLIIRGGSAGGYTTLCALTFHDVFNVGASYYGISDLETLAKDTHKFESRYFEQLIGPYPLRRDLYMERSPINFTDKLSCPVIFFQGSEDKVVPPDQAEKMYQALRDKGLPVAYLAFPGEQHGFRRSKTVRRALEAELYFYSRILGFEPSDVMDPVPIDNM